MILAEMPLLSIKFDDHGRDRSSPEQPPPSFDTRFAPKVGAHNEANPSELIFLVLLHIILVRGQPPCTFSSGMKASIHA